MFKDEIRIIGWDDASFIRGRVKWVRLVGAIVRGGKWLDGLLTVNVRYDGLDVTNKIVNVVNKSRHKEQLRVIMTDGISFAGFNLIDIKVLNEETGLPVIVIIRKKPGVKRFLKAMRIFDDFEKRKKIVENAGRIYSFGHIYFQKAGISKKEAEEIISLSSTRANIPEPIRLAHIIATGLSGESKGRA
ncbi:MAG: DUF99 family protein [Candidatus Aenigmarchaeota archaeon]|nr:DUF99 family protein [Candidatus Aenigmarchaeota archaeon]